jgi:hypothetical protein
MSSTISSDQKKSLVFTIFVCDNVVNFIFIRFWPPQTSINLLAVVVAVVLQ